jgi:threonine/homoserine/homoserine lactone efflux protein
MQLLLPLALGLFFSAAGTLLPGLINMTAAKISIREGRQRAVLFALGASTIVLAQAYIAVSFAKFINSRPDIIYMLQEVGLAIFSGLTIYFLFIGGEEKT